MILAAASGVGTSLIQLCKYLGCESISVSSIYEKLDYCKKLGSFEGISYRKVPKYSELV